jgi:putative ABC transport system permease protein
MFNHYIKMALVVLWRRKFMAFVNIFGIVITLLTLIVGVSLMDASLNPGKAARHTKHYLVVNGLCFKGDRHTENGSVGYAFYTKYLQPLQSADKTSFATRTSSAVVYQQGQKLTLSLRRTDAAYWQIMQHKLLEGRWYDQSEVAKGQFVAVINESTRASYFADVDALDQPIRINGQTFNVIGVVEDEPETSQFSFSDAWVPLTTAPSDNYVRELMGNGQVLIWSDDVNQRSKMASEVKQVASQFEYTPDPALIDRALFLAKTPLENLAHEFLSKYCTSDSHVSTFIGWVSLIAFLFMLLPIINMVNLNVSRILERAPEIGLRKATGASNRLLVGQFLTETLVVTALGGLIAFILAPLVLALLNNTLIRYGQLSLNFSVLLWGVGLILVFGVMSGVYPAWRMSKLSPANALRGGHRHV